MSHLPQSRNPHGVVVLVEEVRFLVLDFPAYHRGDRCSWFGNIAMWLNRRQTCKSLGQAGTWYHNKKYTRSILEYSWSILMRDLLFFCSFPVLQNPIKVVKQLMTVTQAWGTARGWVGGPASRVFVESMHVMAPPASPKYYCISHLRSYFWPIYRKSAWFTTDLRPRDMPHTLCCHEFR